MELRQAGEVGLAGKDDHGRPDLAAGRDQRGGGPALWCPCGPGRHRGAEVRHRRSLDDPGSHSLDEGGEAAHEPPRVHDGPAARPEAGHRARDPDLVRHAGRVQQPIVLAESEALVLAEGALDRRDVVRAAGHDELAALVEAGVDRLLRRDAPHLVDRVVRRLLDSPRGVLAVEAGQALHRDVEVRGAPCAVPPRCPETGDLALGDDDAQAGLPLQEVVGGPQARVAGAQDRDVALGGAVERRARGEIPGGLQPVRDVRVAVHGPKGRGAAPLPTWPVVASRAPPGCAPPMRRPGAPPLSFRSCPPIPRRDAGACAGSSSTSSRCGATATTASCGPASSSAASGARSRWSLSRSSSTC